MLEGGGVALKGAELLKWAAGQNTSGNAAIVVDEFFFCIMVSHVFELITLMLKIFSFYSTGFFIVLKGIKNFYKAR